MNKVTGSSLIFIVLAGLLIYGSLSNNKSTAFEQWKLKYGTHSWTEVEEHYRQIIFLRNLQMINQHNLDRTQTYKMGVNQFTIYQTEQFAQIFLNPIISASSNIQVSTQMNPVNADIDWTTKDVISPVKNQGTCGSCWAFSAIASIQSFFRFKKEHYSLSEQQLVDCANAYGNNGCNGGSHVGGAKYVRDHGVTTQSSYPYVGKTESCKKNGGSYKISAIHTVTGCTGLQNALSSRPLGVAVNAEGWSHYSSGIFSACGSSLNHAVQLVGISASYWKIKNSWGTSWGEHGFIRLHLGNTCGMCSSEGSWVA